LNYIQYANLGLLKLEVSLTSNEEILIFEIPGDMVNIRETMLAKGEDDFYKFKIDVNGNVPVFDSQYDVTFADYVHTYRYDRRGIMSGFYRSSFNVGGKTYEISVVEVLEFDEVPGCSSVASSKMAVSEQRSSYRENSKVLNFALKTEMQDKEGKSFSILLFRFQSNLSINFSNQFCPQFINQFIGKEKEQLGKPQHFFHDCQFRFRCRRVSSKYP
jgi:hypothetical protein